MRRARGSEGWGDAMRSSRAVRGRGLGRGWRRDDAEKATGVSDDGGRTLRLALQPDDEGIEHLVREAVLLRLHHLRARGDHRRARRGGRHRQHRQGRHRGANRDHRAKDARRDSADASRREIRGTSESFGGWPGRKSSTHDSSAIVTLPHLQVPTYLRAFRRRRLAPLIVPRVVSGPSPSSPLAPSSPPQYSLFISPSVSSRYFFSFSHCSRTLLLLDPPSVSLLSALFS